MVRNYRRSTKGRYTVSADPTAQTDRYVDAGDPLAERASVIQRLLVENLLRVCGGAKNVGNLCVIRKTVVKLAVLLLLAAAPAFCQAVALTWAPGTVNAGYTATVTGYNVYRCVGSCLPTVGAGWSQIATGITQLAYTDVGPLTDGSTYNYAVTTIDAAGDESAFSPIFSGVPTGNDVYIAQAAAGGNTGADCADAYAASYFNNSANWTSGTPTGTQIGPGTTVYLCGSFSYGAGTSGALQFQGSGTSGNPIAVVFEPGASATSPNWGPNGFIYASGLSYIAVNGGTNGSITATATGTGLTYSNLTQTSAITFSNVSNSQITGLSISNIYVHTATPTDENGSGSSWGIQWAGGNNITINNNTVHDAYGCIDYYPTSTTWPMKFGLETSVGAEGDQAIHGRRQAVAVAGERAPEIGDQRVALPIRHRQKFRRHHPERQALRHVGAARIGLVAAAEFDRGFYQEAAGIIADRAERIGVRQQPRARRRPGHVSAMPGAIGGLLADDDGGTDSRRYPAR